MAKNSKLDNPKWKVHTGVEAPDLRREIDAAYKEPDRLSRATAALAKEYPLTPFSWFNRGEALNGSMLIPGIMTKLEARKKSYLLIIEAVGSTAYRVGVYTTVGNKAKVPKTAKVVLERKF